MLDKVARHTEVRYLTVGIDVNAAGISMKVVRLTRGGLTSCLALPVPRGAGMGCEKSAEGIVGGVTSRGKQYASHNPEGRMVSQLPKTRTQS